MSALYRSTGSHGWRGHWLERPCLDTHKHPGPPKESKRLKYGRGSTYIDGTTWSRVMSDICVMWKYWVKISRLYLKFNPKFYPTSSRSIKGNTLRSFCSFLVNYLSVWRQINGISQAKLTTERVVAFVRSGCNCVHLSDLNFTTHFQWQLRNCVERM